MTAEFRQGHYILGIEGLALLRAGAQRSFDSVDARAVEIREVVSRLDEPPYSERRDLPEVAVDAGYAHWAEDYDDPGNDTIVLEEPVVRRLLGRLPPGPVLDAACGTGRHAAFLAARGREVIGVDASEEMLARVLEPGGRLIVSNPHPFATAILGWRAVFVDPDGRRAMIPEYPHLHGDYIAAFRDAGLVVRECIEPALDSEQARERAKMHGIDAFEDALTGIPAVIVWEAERPARP